MKTKSYLITQFLSYLLLIVLSVIWIIPIVYGFTTSFRSQTEVVSTGFRLLPVNCVVENYIAIFQDTSTAPIVRWLGNSLFIATIHTALVIVVVSVTAYGYSRLQFKGRDALFFTLMGISMFPGVVNLI